MTMQIHVLGNLPQVDKPRKALHPLGACSPWHAGPPQVLRGVFTKIYLRLASDSLALSYQSLCPI
ncbi:hypothetical protein FQN60_011386 [Etheostoma spectabile]|uniref:Uncharacterized protein n=1 Tax=Etheostoma spectabile TaxID=54343 RepID=A0A5J5DRR8_9PERO|nr:hypothetical protein FQN60_011386 [Etheostoma spectabile]